MGDDAMARGGVLLLASAGDVGGSEVALARGSRYSSGGLGRWRRRQ
jgi:hypothetical protein